MEKKRYEGEAAVAAVAIATVAAATMSVPTTTEHSSKASGRYARVRDATVVMPAAGSVSAIGSVSLSVAESWGSSVADQAPVKLILPDMQYRPYYLPLSNEEKKSKSARLEERTRIREEYLCSRVDESVQLPLRSQIFRLPEKPRLCLGDR
jgi:hypothetical protein